MKILMISLMTLGFVSSAMAGAEVGRCKLSVLSMHQQSVKDAREYTVVTDSYIPKLASVSEDLTFEGCAKFSVETCQAGVFGYVKNSRKDVQVFEFNKVRMKFKSPSGETMKNTYSDCTYRREW